MRPEPRSSGFAGSLGLAAASGLLFGLALEPVSLWPLAPLAVAVLAWAAVRCRSARRAFLVTWLAWAGTWLAIEWWLVQVTALGLSFMVLYLAVFPALFAALLRATRDDPRLRRLPLAVTVPVLWVGQEALRGEILFDGYPWHLLAHPLAAWLPLVQSADLLGTYLVSGLAAAAAGAGADLMVRSGPRPRAAAAVVAALWVANVGYGLVRIAGTPAGPADVTMLVLQTDLPQSNKLRWTEAEQDAWGQELLARTAAALADADDVDLAVVPETMLPGAGLEPETIALLRRFEGFETSCRWGPAMADLVERTGVPVLAGSMAWLDVTAERLDDGLYRIDPGREHNSAYLLQPRRSPQRYDKVHLTPFGEVMPYISAWPWLESRLLALGARGMSFTLDASSRIARLGLDRGGTPVTLATPICYEDTVARVCRAMVWEDGRKRVDVLVNLSNDGWFGWFAGGRARHNQAARFRAIENRVPLVRAANTGQSVGVDPAGKVVARVGGGRYGTAGRAAVLRVGVVLDDRWTLYGRVGDLAAWIAVAGLVLAAIRVFAVRRRVLRGAQA